MWDILLVPTTTVNSSGAASSGDDASSNYKLVSCGAEGNVKVWDVSGPDVGGKLLLSWGYNGSDAGVSAKDGDEKVGNEAPGATSLAIVKTDVRRVAVAYRNAIVKIFEVETGKEVQRLASDVSYGK